MTVEADPQDTADAPKDALSAVITRNVYYKDGYRNLQRIAIIEGVAIVVLVLALLFAVFVMRPEQAYFATTADGRIVPLVPLSAPYVDNSRVIQWGAQAVTETMTFGFHDYQARLNQALQENFTMAGRQSFYDALNRSGLLEGVRTRRQVLSAATPQTPIIIEEGVDGQTGWYRWVLRFPLNLTIESGTKVDTLRYTVSAVIVRVSTLENEDGLGIQQIIMARGG